jgi:hypothetical protein
MPDDAGKSLRYARFHLASLRKDAIHPQAKSLGFSGIAYKDYINSMKLWA